MSRPRVRAVRVPSAVQEGMMNKNQFCVRVNSEMSFATLYMVSAVVSVSWRLECSQCDVPYRVWA